MRRYEKARVDSPLDASSKTMYPALLAFDDPGERKLSEDRVPNGENLPNCSATTIEVSLSPD
jgi:hypothetical protein